MKGFEEAAAPRAAADGQHWPAPGSARTDTELATLDAFASLCLIARLHHVAAEPAALLHQLGKAPSEPFAVDDVLLAARHLGLKAKRSRPTVDRR